MDYIAGEIIFADEAAGDYFSIIECADLRKAHARLSILWTSAFLFRLPEFDGYATRIV
jgi:hypothetical protein